MTRILNLMPTYEFSYDYSPYRQYITVTVQSAEPQFMGGYNGGIMELVASSPNNTTTFLTKEAMATYVYNLYGQNLIDDLNTIADNTLILGALLFVPQDTQTIANTKVDKTTTVNGHALSGNVSVSKSDVGLGNADNTSDTSKPVSTATQTALDGKAAISHTHAIADVTGLQAALDAKSKGYEGTTARSNIFPIFKSASVSSGVIAFHLTADGTSGGTALFPNGVIQDSVNAFVSDAAASYQMSYAFTNSNKTVTVTANKLTTANILTGLLGQAQANGSVVKLSVWGY